MEYAHPYVFTSLPISTILEPMKTRLLLILSLLLTFAAASLCGATETIVFWYGATQDEQAAYKQMITDFEHANPGIKVNAMLVPQSYVERKLILSVAGGVPPDVVRFYAHLGGEIMSRGGLEPLDGLVQRDKFDTDDFYKVGITQNTYGDKLYGIPWVLSPNALFYNKKLFREAGLDPNRPPRTWAELEQYAMKLTKRDKDGKVERVGYADFLYNPNNFAWYLWQSGGEMLSPDGRTARFNGPKGAVALGWMKSFLNREVGGVKDLQTFAANFKGATQDPFGQGLVAMRVDSPFRIPDLKKYFPNLDYGVAAIPFSKQPAAEVVGNSLVIPRGSKHREAAWKFIKFASSPEQLARICKVAGRIPARVSVAHSSEFYSDPIKRGFIDQIDNGRSVPVVPGWQEVADGLAREIEKALKGQKSVQAALDDAAASAGTILGKANENVTRLPEVPWKVLGVLAVLALVLGAVAMTGYVRKHTAHSTIERREAKQFYL
ncbi:ABC transporter substrate-binding protein, partial [bacterium]|nr:ABC transporter substrate-binding protein [bacterium]